MAFLVGYTLCQYFGLESGIVWEATTGAYESIYSFRERNRHMRIRNAFGEMFFAL